MTLSYRIDATNHNSHLLEVELSFNAPWENPILEMPVWTPGSYLVRDYARHVQRFIAHDRDGNELSWQKINKTNWEIKAEKDTGIKVTYFVYAFDFTVRTSYLDDRYGLISPASVFFYIKNKNGTTTKSSKFFVKIDISSEWEIFTSLRSQQGSYVADDFDELVDSPFALAKKEMIEKKSYQIERGIGGEKVDCSVILIGEKGNHDIDKFTENMIKLQKESKKLFGDLPYDQYLWILFVVGSGGGGLEHKYSNVSIIPRWYFDKENVKDKNYARLMGLESHEHFHTYNVKRIRPKQLGPFDYSQEVYTRALWINEGLTSFYDNLFLPRADIIDKELYWKVVADDIKKLDKNYGKYITSLEQSSFDAWIKLYQPDENQINSTVSYYLKGGLVGLLLDLEIRKQTDFEHSLDTFFRDAYEEYKENKQGYDETKFQQLVEKSTGTDLSEFWNKYITGTDELPFNEYLNLIGMKLVTEIEEEIPFIGWELSNSKKIKSVRYDSPAMNGGLHANDKIIAINKFDVKDDLKTILKNIDTNESIEITYFRDKKLYTTHVKPDEPKPDSYEIKSVEEPTDEQISRRKSFFSSDTR